MKRGLSINTEVEFAPGVAPASTVFLNQPLASAAELQARTVHQQVYRFALTTRP